LKALAGLLQHTLALIVLHMKPVLQQHNRKHLFYCNVYFILCSDPTFITQLDNRRLSLESWHNTLWQFIPEVNKLIMEHISITTYFIAAFILFYCTINHDLLTNKVHASVSYRLDIWMDERICENLKTNYVIPRHSRRCTILRLRVEGPTVRTTHWCCYQLPSELARHSWTGSRRGMDSWDFRSLPKTASMSCCTLVPTDK